MSLPRKTFFTALILLTTLALSGCQALYFLAGKGDQEALYVLPKGKRVLVYIDPRPSSKMPADLPYQLGDKLNDHLFRWKSAEHLVAQQRLMDIKRMPNYDKMGIADVAKAADADIVIHVDVIQFVISGTSDDAIMQGWATTIVKVIDRNGNRLWPPETASFGVPIEARAEPTFTDSRDLLALQKELIDLLDVRIGRMFHAYKLEDKTMTR